MPALLTAIVITCGALKAENSPTACRAHVYHGAYAEPATCSQTAGELAFEFERNLISTRKLTRTSSHDECVAAADELEVAAYLPDYMRQRMGADSVKIVHFDLVDGVAVERVEGKPVKKVVKGAAI